MKITNVKKLNYKIYKTKNSPEKLRRVKREGLSLKINDSVYKFRENKELFSYYLPFPEVFAAEIEGENSLVSFSIPVDADKVYIDIKKINRFSENWNKIAEFSDTRSNKIYNILYPIVKSETSKIRVTYVKNRAIEFSDFIFEDPLFKYFSDPPEIVVHSKENILLTIFNLERFIENGYIRILKKENEESEECILTTSEMSKVFSFEDNNVFSNNYYEYRAEIYDNNGNVYKTDSKKILYKKSHELKNIEIEETKNIFSFNHMGFNNIKIEKYNLKTEKADIIPYEIKDEKVTFTFKEDSEYYLENSYSNYLIHVEVYDNLGYLVLHGSTSLEQQREPEIINERITTNSRNENIISWNHTGNIDTFIVTSKSKIRNQLLKIVPHREIKEGYSYCIDKNFKSERINTEYIINAIDEFGKIIIKKRLTKDGK